MKIYGISGLGADKRVFDFLELNTDLIPINWIPHNQKESIKDYSARLSKAIDSSTDFGILGVSFGGLIAVEISKILNPCLTILISSVETEKELRPIYKGLGNLGLLEVLPAKAFNPPRKIAQFVFGSTNKQLLNSILDNTDLEFTKWAINEVTHWKNQDRIKNVIRIHGTKDKVIPWNSSEQVHLIDKGEHFMIVDRAEEISEIINNEVNHFRSGKSLDNHPTNTN